MAGDFFSNAGAMFTGGQINTQAVAVKLVSTGAFIGKILFYFIAIGLVIFLFYFFFFRNNIRVKIFKYSLGKLVEIKTDFGRYVTDKLGSRKIHLWKCRKDTAIPELRYRMKLGKYDYYMFMEDDNGLLHSCDINMNIIKDGTSHQFANTEKDIFGFEHYKDDTTKAKALSIKSEYEQKIRDEKDKYKKSILKLELNEHLRKLAYTEQKIDKIESNINPIPMERIGWLINDYRDQEQKLEKEQDFWDKMEKITPLISHIIIFLLFFFAFKYLSSIGSNVGSGLEAVARSCLGK